MQSDEMDAIVSTRDGQFQDVPDVLLLLLDQEARDPP